MKQNGRKRMIGLEHRKHFKLPTPVKVNECVRCGRSVAAGDTDWKNAQKHRNTHGLSIHFVVCPFCR